LDFSWFTTAFGTVTGVATVIGAIGVMLTLHKLWADRLHVHVIKSPHDDDLVHIWELQKALFEPHDCDTLEDLQDWVEHNGRGNDRPGDLRQHFVILALKSKRKVCGFIYAQYFPLRQTGFLGFLVVQPGKDDAEKIVQDGALMLLKGMLRAFDKTGHRWRFIVTEVQDLPNTSRAYAKLRRFNNAAEKLSAQAGKKPVGVFRMPVAYEQPPLDLERFAETDLDAWRNPHWLLIAPRREEDLRTSGSHKTLSKQLVGEVLETLAMSYAENFPESKAYGAYLQKQLASYKAALPEAVPLQRPRRRVRPQNQEQRVSEDA
jgi:hypothetical protein